MDSAYCMLSIHKKCMDIRHDILWMKKTYGKYVSRITNTKTDDYILQYEERSNKWVHIEIDPITTEHVNIDQDHRGK